MKKTNYCVWFLFGGNIFISAFSALEAVILASTERINQAKSFDIQSVENMDTDEIEISVPSILVLLEKK